MQLTMHDMVGVGVLKRSLARSFLVMAQIAALGIHPTEVSRGGEAIDIEHSVLMNILMLR